ncbi:hypothetical protein [Chondromyces apiculatus]|uniref:Uncharacterized protein n=1 Tax=Chondromyces apiculatus DSM 436 TaxID=1192034 RepID=A0A017STT0_9BACT|nr:hypothetical protein [Chondromyces apiculatus]EYE99999.1 Hypothetical protein CAP_1644 [Chondromyces apiculatus DSM 436]
MTSTNHLLDVDESPIDVDEPPVDVDELPPDVVGAFIDVDEPPIDVDENSVDLYAKRFDFGGWVGRGVGTGGETAHRGEG